MALLSLIPQIGPLMTTEPLPRAVDAKHLTEALRRSGALSRGRVCNVAVESSLKKLRSLTLRLRLTYEGPSGDAPSYIILKTGHLDRPANASHQAIREVTFYRDIASLVPRRLAPRCFEAIWEADTKGWHLLLEDLTDSHFIATEWPLPPTTEQCASIVRAQARFHAAWWDDPRLGVSVENWADADPWKGYLRSFAERLALFVDRFGEFMPPERHELYQRFLDRAPHLLARYHSRRNLTIIHNDAHVWNFFLPRSGEDEDIRLIDWEDWHIDTGTTALAYMMAMHWYPDRRRRIENALLDRYHETLLAHGVSGYDRQELGRDYRLSVLWLIRRPIVQAAVDIPPRVWWNNLERIMLAVEDLGCRELLE